MVRSGLIEAEKKNEKEEKESRYGVIKKSRYGVIKREAWDMNGWREDKRAIRDSARLLFNCF